MKKLSIFLSSVLAVSAAFAQGNLNSPNRIIVNNNAGGYQGYVIDYVDNISFAKVDGEVLAEVTVDKVGLKELTLTVEMTDECKAYKLTVLPQTVVNQFGNDANAIRYINSLPSGDVPYLTENFDGGTLSGISLNADSKYSVVTIGIDMYGVEAGVSRADFETPKPEIQGNPHVEVQTLGYTKDSFTCKFTPNSDVKSYWTVAGEKGTMQTMYEQFAPMFGFSNFSEMIKMWGVEKSGVSENTWDDMAPNTEYEIFIAMTDKKGNFAPYETYLTQTESLGGPGEATVAIDLVSYTATDWNGQMLPTQSIKFTPNDQASCYRYALHLAEEYDKQKNEIQSDLRSDPEMPTAYWFQYEEATSEYQLNLSTEYVAIAAAKNINGTWGKITELRFTTPATCPGYNGKLSPSNVIRMRDNKTTTVTKGIIPSNLFKKNAITLTK